MNTWVHVAATFDGANLNLYTNGVLSVTAKGTLGATNSSPLEIGESGTCGETFDGLLNAGSIYNRALSASEVASIYLAGANGKCPQPSPATVRN